jgi:hypothetical protein
MAGRFSLKTRAAIAQIKVVEPTTGNMPGAVPKAMLSDIFSTLMPSPRSIFISLRIFILTEVTIFKSDIFARYIFYHNHNTNKVIIV